MAKVMVKSEAAKERKKRCRKNHRRKVRAIISSRSIDSSIDSGRRALLEHRQKNNAGRWWLSDLLDQPDHGISKASRESLRVFWRRPKAEDQMTTVSLEGGKVEKVPDLDEETLALWKRFESAWKQRKPKPQLRPKFNTNMTAHELLRYHAKNAQGRRWLGARMQLPGQGGISTEVGEELLRFFRMEQPDRQWKIVSGPGGKVDQVPNLSDESSALWKRLQAERRKAESMAPERKEPLGYSRRSDWWPKWDSLPAEERLMRTKEWAEEGGWDNAERDFGSGSDSEEEDDWDNEDEENVGEGDMEVDVEQADLVSEDESAGYQQDEKKPREDGDKGELGMYDAEPVTKEELESFEMKVELEMYDAEPVTKAELESFEMKW